MRRKSPLRLAAILALAIVILLGSSNFSITLSRSSMVGVAVGAGDPPPIPQKVFLNDTFEGIKPGQPAPGWNVNPDTGGNFTVTNETAYTGQNSAKFTVFAGFALVTAAKYFSQQNDTIVVSFSVQIPNNTGIHTWLEVSVDDGNLNGSNIIFNGNSIQYFDGVKGIQTLRSSYVANRWYRIEFIMDIPSHVYNIHIDDHLEAANAKFNGTVTTIQRIALIENDSSENSTPYPGGLVAYIDDVLGVQGLNVPNDFPTIQAAVNAASPGDTIVLNASRIYFENVIVPSYKNGITLEGQDLKTTIIDGKFNMTNPYCILLNGCSNVTICGLTLRNSYKSDAQIDIKGNGTDIFSNIIIAGLGSGIKIAGSNTKITDNLIQDNPIGIDIVTGQGTFVQNNTILNNTAIGLRCQPGSSNSLIYGNRFVKNIIQALDEGTTNKWDDGYPYVPSNETGGGNYWSDFTNCTDIYSGMNQDIGPPCTVPSPDGICDQPYHTGVNGIDNYPLFLIQNVTQTPPLIRANCALQVYDKSVEYNDTVTVTVTVLPFVNLITASLFINYTLGNGTTGNIAVSQSNVQNNKINFAIPSFKYNTTVNYFIRVLADGSDWINSTKYPIPFPYLVDDMYGPVIDNVFNDPPHPDQNQTVHVYAHVWEDSNGAVALNASGVDIVFLIYFFNGSTYITQMQNITDGNYTSVIPIQLGGAPLNYNVTAFDNADNQGNWNNTAPPYVKRLGQPQLLPNENVFPFNIPYDPCIVDFGTVSGDKKYIDGFFINNTDSANDDSLGYSIIGLINSSWLSLNTTGGVIPPGQWINVQVTIDTNGIIDELLNKVPGRQDAVLQVSMNGTILNWGVVIRIDVRDVIIDVSAVLPSSSESPNRVNVGSNQIVAFHAEWALNYLSAINGALTLGSSDNKQQYAASVNNTGWATFTVNRTSAVAVTFWIKSVQFGNVTSFWQTAQNRTIIWERVNITLSMVNNYVDVDSPASISWNGSTYESDKTPFKGSALFNDSLTRDHVDEARISASAIVDDAYPSVTAFDTNSVNVIWDEIRIIQGGVSNTQANSGQQETVWFIAIYEWENTLFRGENGTMTVSVTIGNDTSKVPLSYSFDDLWDWQRLFNYTSGTVTFQVSEVEDNVHHLTKIKDGVGPLNITWGPKVKPFWDQWFQTNANDPPQNDPSQPAASTQASPSFSYVVFAVILAVAVALGLIFTLLLLISSRKKPKSTAPVKKIGQANQSFTQTANAEG